jgi:hypothetical protein
VKAAKAGRPCPRMVLQKNDSELFTWWASERIFEFFFKFDNVIKGCKKESVAFLTVIADEMATGNNRKQNSY